MTFPVVVEALVPAIQYLLTTMKSRKSTLAAASYFEEEVFRLLDQAAQAEGRAPIQTQWTGGTAFRFDGYLPEGISDLDGPLLLEVKYLPGTTQAAVQDLAETIQRSAMETMRIDARGLLVIHNVVLTDAAQDHVQNVLANFQDVRVFVWGLKELNEFAATRVAGAPAIISHQNSRLELELRGSDEWRAKRDGYLATLRQEYNENGVAIFLGAGVSQGSKLPTWTDLVSGLFTMAFTEKLGAETNEADVGALSRALAELNPSNLQLTRYLRQAMRADAKEFVDEVAKLLYRNFSTGVKSPLLNEVVDLCRPTRSGARVHGVITYNFDDLLESGFTESKVEHLSIFHGDTYPSVRQLPVYHVHGFIPRDFTRYDRIEDNLLIFSEENYHRVYTDPYHWSNIVQLSTLHERTCILLGLSMTDPNLRRLLEAGTRDSTAPRHYAFMKRSSRDDLIKVEPAVDALPAALVDDFLRAHHVTQAAVMEEIGVNVVWFDDHSEMPDALRQLSS